MYCRWDINSSEILTPRSRGGGGEVEEYVYLLVFHLQIPAWILYCRSDWLLRPMDAKSHKKVDKRRTSGFLCQLTKSMTLLQPEPSLSRDWYTASMFCFSTRTLSYMRAWALTTSWGGPHLHVILYDIEVCTCGRERGWWALGKLVHARTV